MTTSKKISTSRLHELSAPKHRNNIGGVRSFANMSMSAAFQLDSKEIRNGLSSKKDNDSTSTSIKNVVEYVAPKGNNNVPNSISIKSSTPKKEGDLWKIRRIPIDEAKCEAPPQVSIGDGVSLNSPSPKEEQVHLDPQKDELLLESISTPNSPIIVAPRQRGGYAAPKSKNRYPKSLQQATGYGRTKYVQGKSNDGRNKDKPLFPSFNEASTGYYESGSERSLFRVDDGGAKSIARSEAPPLSETCALAPDGGVTGTSGEASSAKQQLLDSKLRNSNELNSLKRSVSGSSALSQPPPTSVPATPCTHTGPDDRTLSPHLPVLSPPATESTAATGSSIHASSARSDQSSDGPCRGGDEVETDMAPREGGGGGGDPAAVSSQLLLDFSSILGQAAPSSQPKSKRLLKSSSSGGGGVTPVGSSSAAHSNAIAGLSVAKAPDSPAGGIKHAEISRTASDAFSSSNTSLHDSRDANSLASAHSHSYSYSSIVYHSPLQSPSILSANKMNRENFFRPEPYSNHTVSASRLVSGNAASGVSKSNLSNMSPVVVPAKDTRQDGAANNNRAVETSAHSQDLPLVDVGRSETIGYSLVPLRRPASGSKNSSSSSRAVTAAAGGSSGSNVAKAVVAASNDPPPLASPVLNDSSANTAIEESTSMQTEADATDSVSSHQEKGDLGSKAAIELRNARRRFNQSATLVKTTRKWGAVTSGLTLSRSSSREKEREDHSPSVSRDAQSVRRSSRSDEQQVVIAPKKSCIKRAKPAIYNAATLRAAISDSYFRRVRFDVQENTVFLITPRQERASASGDAFLFPTAVLDGGDGEDSDEEGGGGSAPPRLYTPLSSNSVTITRRFNPKNIEEALSGGGSLAYREASSSTSSQGRDAAQPRDSQGADSPSDSESKRDIVDSSSEQIAYFRRERFTVNDLLK